MTKALPESLNDIINDAVAGSTLSFKLYSRPFDPEAVISQMLDNNVAVLDDLRREAFGAGQKDKGTDVRLHGHPATELLAGFETKVDYYGLVAVINSMKAGIARRRVAAIEVQS